MSISRRHALLATLFGAGGVGLRALATGLPVSFFLNPRKAMAGGADAACAITSSKAQYVIFSTSGQGDPIAWLQQDQLLGERRVVEQTEHRSAGRQAADAVCGDEGRRILAGVGVAEAAIGGDHTVHQRYEVRFHGAPAQRPIDTRQGA